MTCVFTCRLRKQKECTLITYSREFFKLNWRLFSDGQTTMETVTYCKRLVPRVHPELLKICTNMETAMKKRSRLFNYLCAILAARVTKSSRGISHSSASFLPTEQNAAWLVSPPTLHLTCESVTNFLLTWTFLMWCGYIDFFNSLIYFLEEKFIGRNETLKKSRVSTT